jgi:hypothetical protein
MNLIFTLRKQVYGQKINRFMPEFQPGHFEMVISLRLLEYIRAEKIMPVLICFEQVV